MTSPRYFTSPGGPASEPGRVCRCGLCPSRCRIAPGGTGRCGVRSNRDGTGALPFYGFITALAEDPIEKKPLYHWRPGSSILSVGFAGCNLRCPFCQNWRISQTTDVRGETLSPAELIAAAGSGGFDQIAYTYSEPLVHAEYLLDCMALARRAGIANVLVSNGCVTPEAAADILALTDAANVDLKAFSSDTYARVLGGDLAAVLAFIEKARALGVHLEITTLMVPGLNDGGEETGKYIEFIRGLSPDTPWHLSAYHPDYRWDAPPTDPRRLAETARRARRDLKYVYTGNTGESNATPCPHCGGVLVERRNYRIRTELGVKKTASGRAYYCGHCGKPVPFIVG